jgi:hypothetical protein
MSYKKDVTSSNYIKFHPSACQEIGNKVSTLIVGKLEFWFSNSRYMSGFYKFIEPCLHPLYRKGDSWSEELGISRKVFNRAFDVIGVRYKSKTDFLNAEDKFQGKLYASYHDRSTNQTYYVRNHDFASQFFERIFKKKTSSPSLTKREEKPAELPKDFSQTIQQSAYLEGRSRNGQNGHSYARVFSFHKKTSSVKNKSENPQETRESEINSVTEGMIKIWNEEIGELGIATVSKRFLKRLWDTLKTFFNMSLSSWKQYCRMIASSKFLMGEAQNKFFKRAWITWAIKAESIDRIQGGGFNLGDRQTNHDKEIELINEEIRKMEVQKEELDEKIKKIKESEKIKRKKAIKEKYEKLSNEETIILKQDFENMLQLENNSLTEEFNKFKWNGAFISAYFEDFVEDRLSVQLFESSLEEAKTQAVGSSGLLEALQNVNNRILQLKQKKSADIKELSPQETELLEAILLKNTPYNHEAPALYSQFAEL